jgi:AraC-like DNA-binding protein
MDIEDRSTDQLKNACNDEFLKCVVDMDTSSAPPSEQHDLFCSWHADVADIELIKKAHNSFQVRERIWQLGEITALLIEYPGTSYRRRWHKKRDPFLDHWLVSIPIPSVRNTSDNARVGQLKIEHLSAHESEIEEDDGVIAFFLPGASIPADPSRLTVRDEMKEFLSNYLLLLLRSLSAFKITDVPNIVSATTSLVTACLSPSREHFVEAQRSMDIVHMDRAAKIIAERLGDRDLTPDQLCRQLGISRSSLYRLFEPVGGVSSYVRRQRLLKTREMLSDRSDGRTISSIAEEWSFTDPSAYSRMFRKEFGISPREAREKGRKNLTRPIEPDVRERIDRPLTLGNLLLSHN